MLTYSWDAELYLVRGVPWCFQKQVLPGLQKLGSINLLIWLFCQLPGLP